MPRTERPRADAQHNRREILAAARTAVQGSGDVWLDKIAQAAGVSARTLYRHFPTKDDLLTAVLEEYFAEQVEPIRRRVAAEPDPRRALEIVLESGVEAFREHPGILALVNGNALAAEIAGRHLGAFGEVLSRAQEAGAVRADLTLDDLPCLITMVTAVAGTSWPRCLALLLDGLSPAAVSGPLPHAR
ncbi:MULTISPECIES: TetR/AcrR family transcriptional regulator [Amycolatopsis]|uniref:TetR/AcrR family transcriptional regulator n=1 Tax=Amycolatopsis dendrobii TaxID=2760662 RepID=A0A7W3ZAY4_9PSEU|nr:MULTISPECIES: TetR/AcrR family transcriptional regulator [Amycolatopsis]MBB1154289.1 TetR/AcrR family transcriptional regulator [Amycolatopsis dendrobii]UKD51333.1 TetR/AcrR family transcriptional regulator [Amycolatopsis sp. FU40]